MELILTHYPTETLVYTVSRDQWFELLRKDDEHAHCIMQHEALWEQLKQTHFSVEEVMKHHAAGEEMSDTLIESMYGILLTYLSPKTCRYLKAYPLYEEVADKITFYLSIMR